jgi:hypothetical protein
MPALYPIPGFSTHPDHIQIPNNFSPTNPEASFFLQAPAQFKIDSCLPTE